MSDFKIQCSLMAAKGGTELDVTMSRLTVLLSDRVVTEYEDDHEQRVKFLEIPAYYLAEWIAENWWPLLWEPRKSEDASDTKEFLARHSTLTAQHGFALPNLVIVPQGRGVDITARARNVSFADIRFVHSAKKRIARPTVEAELRAFVSHTVERLTETNIDNTDLQNDWALIVNTQEEETEFCTFMGALGLSPYISQRNIEDCLERLLPIVGEKIVLDLCLASSPENFKDASGITEHAFEAAAVSNQTACLEPLLAIQLPGENFSIPAWRRGVQAAKRARAGLKISDSDPRGAEKFFDLLKFEPAFRTSHEIVDADAIIVGLVKREDVSAKVALLQKSESKRRFAGARAGFAAWASESPTESRLLTLAVTRDQQASRAFAAEMTAPFEFLRSRAKKSKLSYDQVFELSGELKIDPDVVRYQAENNGLIVGAF